MIIFIVRIFTNLGNCRAHRNLDRSNICKGHMYRNISSNNCRDTVDTHSPLKMLDLSTLRIFEIDMLGERNNTILHKTVTFWLVMVICVIQKSNKTKSIQHTQSPKPHLSANFRSCCSICKGHGWLLRVESSVTTTSYAPEKGWKRDASVKLQHCTNETGKHVSNLLWKFKSPMRFFGLPNVESRTGIPWTGIPHLNYQHLPTVQWWHENHHWSRRWEHKCCPLTQTTQ